jgi:hypothetical protein
VDQETLRCRSDHSSSRRFIVSSLLLSLTLHTSHLFRILPPGTVHAVYTPVASFATGGHFYHYMCMHLTELSRYIDAEVADSTTNQDLEHALETLRRMMIMVPYLSPTIGKTSSCTQAHTSTITISPIQAISHRSLCDDHKVPTISCQG